jgi:antitoxin (DNA-binding transcriptional repressor) of toxin-antitoxin stability system
MSKGPPPTAAGSGYQWREADWVVPFAWVRRSKTDVPSLISRWRIPAIKKPASASGRRCQQRGLASDVLHLTHMETIGVRELQQHASAALRRVARGETIGVTDRGRLVAVLAPPSTATGTGAVFASGRVQPATRAPTDLPKAVRASRPSSEVLDERRHERDRGWSGISTPRPS